MDRVYFQIELPGYLRDWFVDFCGGDVPVSLPKGGIESIIVQMFTRAKGEIPEGFHEDGLPIYIPENKYKPAVKYPYVPPRAKKAVESAIRSRFDLCLFDDLVKHLFPTSLKKDLIWAWMEDHHIEMTETNWLAIEKRYARLRNSLTTRVRQKETAKNRSE